MSNLILHRTNSKKTRLSAFGVVTLVSLILLDVHAQEATTYPQWTSDPSLTDIGWLPESYTGPFGHRARFAIRRQSNARHGRVEISASILSGILAVHDVRSSTTGVKSGWATGLDRVYSVIPWKDSEDTLVKFVVCGWKTEELSSRVLVVAFPGSGPPIQNSLATSAALEIWTAGTIIQGHLYLYEVNAHSLKRFVDTDNNNIPDQRDPSFVVTVPQDWQDPVHGGLARLVSNPMSFRRASAPYTVDVLTEHTKGRKVFVQSTSNGFQLVLGPLGPVQTKFKATRPFVAGQMRLRVYGSPMTEVYLERQLENSETIPLSTKSTIPRDGWVAIDLANPLEAGWKVRVVSSNTQVSPEPWRTVEAPGQALLFSDASTFSKLPCQGQVWELQGDLFTSRLEAWFSSPSHPGGIRLNTTFIERYTLNLQMPVMGNPSATPPHRNEVHGSLWLKNIETNQTASAPVPFFITYDE